VLFGFFNYILFATSLSVGIIASKNTRIKAFLCLFKLFVIDIAPVPVTPVIAFVIILSCQKALKIFQFFTMKERQSLSVVNNYLIVFNEYVAFLDWKNWR